VLRRRSLRSRRRPARTRSESGRSASLKSYIGTFNYDTFLETALAEHGRGAGFKEYADPDELVRHSTYRLFKLHGSVHWGTLAEERDD
jgi:hypothetical protein